MTLEEAVKILEKDCYCQDYIDTDTCCKICSNCEYGMVTMTEVEEAHRVIVKELPMLKKAFNLACETMETSYYCCHIDSFHNNMCDRHCKKCIREYFLYKAGEEIDREHLS